MNAIEAWSLIGFLFFLSIAAVTGGRMHPILAVFFAAACGPLTWAAVIGAIMAPRQKTAPPEQKEANYRRAFMLLEDIYDDHHDRNGSTYLRDTDATQAKEIIDRHYLRNSNHQSTPTK